MGPRASGCVETMTDQDAGAAARSVWGATPAGSTYGGGAEPGTRAFFESVVERRSVEEQPYLRRIVPFASYQGKRVLELGCGAGYDAYDFCRHGADYTGVDIAPENVRRTLTHLAFYGFQPHVLEADAENLPFPSASFDVAYSNGVLHHVGSIERAFAETHRVLRPGGHFWVIVYHRTSVFYWATLFLYQHLARLGFLRMPFKERLARIEYTTSDQLPVVNTYTRREVRDLLTRTGFVADRIYVRKLRPEDLPAIPILRRFYPRIPQRWLDRVGQRWGWYVIARATKPSDDA